MEAPRLGEERPSGSARGMEQSGRGRWGRQHDSVKVLSATEPEPWGHPQAGHTSRPSSADPCLTSVGAAQDPGLPSLTQPTAP